LARVSLNGNPLLAAEHPDGTQQILNSLLKKFFQIFEPPSPGMSVEMTVKAEIRTSTQDPTYTKSYPYPVKMRREFERQIEELLQDGIIRPSNRPYNSPIWIVPKKPKPNGEKQYRMVVDFSTLKGKYEFPHLPFGLKSAPAILQKIIDEVLREHFWDISSRPMVLRQIRKNSERLAKCHPQVLCKS